MNVDEADAHGALYSALGGASLVFRMDVLNGVHIFRQTNSGFAPICDQVMFDALARADLTEARLRDCSHL